MAGEVGGDEPWVVYLNQEINESEKDSVDQDITIIIRDIIASTAASEDAIKNAAVRLDTKYQSIHNAVEPIDVILNVVRHIPYDDERQDRLIKLLRQLLEVTDKSPEDWADHRSTLGEYLEGAWNGNFVHDRHLKGGEDAFRTRCDEWLNFSVFKARTLAARLGDHFDDSFKAPDVDIDIGLELGDREKNNPNEVLRNCRLMVAAQYILVAGDAIRVHYGDPEESKGGWKRDTWTSWAEGFREASNWDNVQESTRLAAAKAHDKMVALWPDLFSAAEGDDGHVVPEGT